MTSRHFAEPAGTGLPVAPGHPTAPRGRFPKAALATVLAVAAGFWLGATYLPGPPTPIHAAMAYTEAGFARDWPSTWAQMCRSLQAVTDYDKYLDMLEGWAEHTSEPTDVDIETGDMELVHVGSRSYFVVTMKATTDEPGWENWRFEEPVPLIQEAGEFRMCVPEDGSWRP
jgi:hypothetical protein